MTSASSSDRAPIAPVALRQRTFSTLDSDAFRVLERVKEYSKEISRQSVEL